MPRILFGVTVPTTAQAFLRDQISDLLAERWEVHLVTSPRDGTNSFEQLNAIAGLDLHPIAMARQPSIRQDLKSLVQWIRLLARVRPDIVVMSTPKAGFIGMLAARLTNIHHRVYHIRGLRAEGLNGISANLSLFAEHVAVKCSTAILCDSFSLAEKLREYGLLSKKRDATVLGAGSCCGVDTSHFYEPNAKEREEARRQWNIESDDIVVGFVGRLTSDKGIPELVAAMSTAVQDDQHLQLFLFGPCEESQQLAKPLGKIDEAKWAHFLGPISDPRAAYWAMDIFCLPSHREGFPIASLEAQACGLPVITTNATGCIDSVQINKTGLVASVGDEVSLADAIGYLAKNSQLRKTMAREARQRMELKFEASSVRRRHIRFYQALIQGAR